MSIRPMIIRRTGAFALLLSALGAGCIPAEDRVAVADAAHNSRNSLDWAGTYRGVLPCADCPGIETTVTLRADGTYLATSHYLDNGPTVTGEGRFTWSDDGGSVNLMGEESGRYHVGENRLTRLALDGSKVEGPLAEHYVLTKIDSDDVAVPLIGTQWQLVELRGQPVVGFERAPYLTLGAEDGRVSGFGGCNTFGGRYTLDEERLRLSFEQVVSTLKACPTGMDVEQTLYEVLGQVDNYTLSSDRLTLNRARMAPLAVFESQGA